MSATTLSPRVDPTRGRVAAPTLHGFAAAATAPEGVWLSSLPAISQFEIQTRNSLYQITLLDGGDGRVQVLGGPFFPVWSEAQLTGSTLGGCFLKMRWVGCGFCMEFLHQGQRIVTTRVQEIRAIEPVPATVC